VSPLDLFSFVVEAIFQVIGAVVDIVYFLNVFSLTPLASKLFMHYFVSWGAEQGRTFFPSGK